MIINHIKIVFKYAFVLKILLERAKLYSVDKKVLAVIA